MYARVATATLKPGTSDPAGKKWTEYMEMFKDKGLHGGYLVVDSSSWKMISITIWETREAEDNYATSPEQTKGRAAMSQFFAEPLSVSRYEVIAKVG